MNLALVAEQVNEYAMENQDRDFLAYADYDGTLAIMTTYRKYPLDSSSEERRVIKFSDELLTQYKKETGPEFIKVLWGRTWNFSWNVDSNNYVKDSRHIF